MLTIDERLKELRKQKKLTQKQVAKAIGLGDSNYQAYEQKKVKPGHDMIIALSKFFGVSADYLLGLSDDPERR